MIGLYLFNRDKMYLYNTIEYTKCQFEEDIEQLKIMEMGYKIKSYETPYHYDRSVNTQEDLDYFINLYNHQ